MYMIDFGDNLYLWRLFRNMSQKDLAIASGVPRPNISTIENSKREPSLSSIRRLARAIRVNAGDLINGVPPKYFGGDKPVSRISLERIVYLIIGEKSTGITSDERELGKTFSNIVKNKLNAVSRVYKRIPERDRSYENKNSLILKASFGSNMFNNILSRIDKNILTRTVNHG